VATETGAPSHAVAETKPGPPYRVRSASVLGARHRFVYVVLLLLWLAVNANFWVWWLRREHIEAAWMYWPFTR
jgi:hypothetical protein